MMRTGLIALAGLAFAHAASADTYECKRYKSKCTGNKCFILAEGIQQKDAVKKALPIKNPEALTYNVTPTGAVETIHPRAIDDAKDDTPTIKSTTQPQYEYKPVNYDYVTITSDTITLENKIVTGQVKDRIKIIPANGFYSYYQLHTDGTIKEVPVGTPYAAYFGWCDKTETDPAAPAPVAMPMSKQSDIPQ